MIRSMAALAAALCSLGAHALTLEEHAKTIEADYKLHLGKPLKGDMVIEQAMASGKRFVITMKTPKTFNPAVEKELAALPRETCSSLNMLTSFVAAGGIIDFGFRFSDGIRRSVELNERNCRPPADKQLTREDLQRIVDAKRAQMPLKVGDGMFLRSIELQQGLTLFYRVDVEQLTLQQASALSANAAAREKLKADSEKMFCENPTTRHLLTGGATLVYAYMSHNFVLNEVRVSRQICKL